MSQVTVASEQTPQVWRVTTDAELRVYCNQAFQSNDGLFVPQGVIDGKLWYFAGDIIPTGQVALLPALTLTSTEDALTNQQATYSAYIYQKRTNKRLGVLLERFAVPPEPVSTSWAQLTIHKQGVIPRTNNDTYTKQAVDALIVATIANQQIKSSGVAVLAVGAASSVVTVPYAGLKANSRIIAFSQDPNVSGVLHAENFVVGVSFDIVSSVTGDEGTVFWIALEN